jgi:hypothetical protein
LPKCKEGLGKQQLTNEVIKSEVWQLFKVILLSGVLLKQGGTRLAQTGIPIKREKPRCPHNAVECFFFV